MAGKFVVITAKNGEFTFNLKASNGEVILTASETYTTMSACENGIASVKKNSGVHIEDQTRGEEQKCPKYELYKDKGITKIVGVESRGFIMAAALAARLGCGVVLARKPGKLPYAVIKESFSKEY
jgi:uncharacterized protein YegP (UPF0339 family)